MTLSGVGPQLAAPHVARPLLGLNSVAEYRERTSPREKLIASRQKMKFGGVHTTAWRFVLEYFALSNANR
jgi:hypothetical protein